MNWISVKDRLPEKEIKVLGYFPIFDLKEECNEDRFEIQMVKLIEAFNNPYWFIYISFDGCNCFSDEHINMKPTHWMPLPEAPK